MKESNTPTRKSKRQDFGKRTHAEIRNSIQASLKKRAMGIVELANDNNMHPETVKRHLAWLEEIGEVSQWTVKWQGKEKTLWKLNR